MIPIGGSLPSVHDKKDLEFASQEFQRLFDLLNLQSGSLNFEFIFDDQNNLFIIEVGPRNGGNLIPELTYYATGVNLIECTVKAALGVPCKNIINSNANGYFAYYVIHSQRNGVLQKIEFDIKIKKHISEALKIIENQ